MTGYNTFKNINIYDDKLEIKILDSAKTILHKGNRFLIYLKKSAQISSTCFHLVLTRGCLLDSLSSNIIHPIHSSSIEYS